MATLTFEEQLKLLKERIIKAFANQTNFQSDPDDWDLQFRRISGNEIMNIQLTTKRTDDDLRLMFKSSDYLSPVTNVGFFNLQVRPGYVVGTLKNEVYVSYGALASWEFPGIYNYLNSPEFLEYQKSKPRLLTMDNKVLCLLNGHPLETQY